MNASEEKTALPPATGPDMAGRYWVQLTPDMARAHPKGRPGVVLYMIAAWFLVLGVMQSFVLGGLFGLIVTLIYALLALMLAIGAPWARVIAIVFCIMGMGAPAGILFAGPDGGALLAEMFVMLAIVLFNVFIIFHLFDGERPNLVYSHRYRSYRAEDAADRESGNV